MTTRLFIALTFAIVAIAVVSGVLIVGGPIQGRQDRLDAQRLRALSALARALLCERRPGAPERALPERLTVETMRAHCAGAMISANDLTDTETGTPYAYTRLDDRAFTVCATFYNAARVVDLAERWQGAPFDPDTGCLSGRVR